MPMPISTCRAIAALEPACVADESARAADTRPVRLGRPSALAKLQRMADALAQ
jgi:hypothetical protein